MRALFINDPAPVLKQNGIEVPEGIAVKILERKANEIHIPLPPKLVLESNRLSEKELESFAGGIYCFGGGAHEAHPSESTAGHNMGHGHS